MMCPSAWSSGITGQPDRDSQKEQPQQKQPTQQQLPFSQQPMHYLQQQALAASRLLQQQSRPNSSTGEKKEPGQSQQAAAAQQQQQTKTEQTHQQQYQTPAQQLHQLQHHGFQPQYQHHYPAHPHFLYHHQPQYQPYTMQQQQPHPHPGKQQMYVPYGTHYSAMHEPTSCPPMASQQAAQQSQSDNGAPEMAVCSDVKAPALSNTLFSVLQKELQDYVVDEKEISIAGENDKNDGRLRERQETKYSNLLCSLVYFTATDRDGTVHAARGAQVLKRALNSHKLRHFVKTIVPKVDRVQAATKLFDNMKEVLSKISKNTTNAARQLRTTMLACIVSCDLDNKEKKMLSRCLLDEGATKMQKARIHKQLKEASKRRADFFQGQRDFIWESGRAKRKDALSDDMVTAVQDAIRTLTAVPPAEGGGSVAKKGRTESGGATPSSPASEDSNPAEGALPTCDDDSGEESDSTTGSRSSSGSSASSVSSHSSVQECTDAELHRKVLQYLNDERNNSRQGSSSKKPISLSIDRFRIIKRGMGSVKRFDTKRLNNRKRKAASS